MHHTPITKAKGLTLFFRSLNIIPPSKVVLEYMCQNDAYLGLFWPYHRQE